MAETGAGADEVAANPGAVDEAGVLVCRAKGDRPLMEPSYYTLSSQDASDWADLGTYRA